MNVIRVYCLLKRKVIEDFLDGWSVICMRFNNKIFVIVNYEEGEKVVIILKCDLEVVLRIREDYLEIIILGYYMNKKYWNIVYIYKDIE